MRFGGEEGVLRAWSKQKLGYLESYLQAYAKATTRALQRFYIDGFAGKGYWRDPDSDQQVPGSPIIALSTKPAFTECHLIELDGDNYRALRQAVDQYPNARVHAGDCNVLIPRVLANIHERAPTFLFLDPTGLQLKWSTIESVVPWRVEIFLTFPYHMAIQRLLPTDQSQLSEEDRQALNPYLPPNWEDAYDQCVGTYRRRLPYEVLKTFKTQLEYIGLSHAIVSRVVKTPAGLPLYYLIWAGKTDLGERIARYVLHKQFNSQVRFELAGPDWLPPEG